MAVKTQWPIGLSFRMLAWGALVLAASTELAAQQAAVPRFSVDHIVEMIQNDVSTIDILNELQRRRLDTPVSAAVFEKLKSEGASALLLARISDFGVTQFPEDVREWKEMHTHYRLRRHWTGIIEQANIQLTRQPYWTDVLRDRATANLEIGRIQESIEDLEAVSRLSPGTEEDTLHLVTAYLRANNAKKAIEQATRLIDDKWSSHGNANLLRANAHMQLGDYDNAHEDLKIAIQRMPNDVETQIRLAYLLLFSPDPAVRNVGAADQLIRIAESLSKVPRTDLVVCQAASAAEHGRLPEAVLLLERVRAEDRTPDAESQLQSYRDGKVWRLPAGQFRASSVSNVVGLLIGNMKPVDLPSDSSASKQQRSRFSIGRHEVTNAEWALVMQHPVVGDPDSPRDMVSLQDALNFIERLNTMAGQSLFRLPTENEWQIASGTAPGTKYYFGDDESKLKTHAWFQGNSDQKLHPVESLAANSLGLHDLYGNVAEWCAPGEDVVHGPADDGGKRSTSLPDFGIVLGGNVYTSAKYCNSVTKIDLPALDRKRGVGFRLAANSLTEVDLARTSPLKTKSGLDAAIAALEVSTEKLLDSQQLGRLYYLRACDRTNEGDIEGGVSDFGRVIQTAALRMQSPGAPGYWQTLSFLALCQRGWLLATTDVGGIRNLDQARADAENANALCENGNDWTVHALLAAIAAAKGDFNKAMQREEQALPLAERTDLNLKWSGPESAANCRKRLDAYRINRVPAPGKLLIPLRQTSPD